MKKQIFAAVILLLSLFFNLNCSNKSTVKKVDKQFLLQNFQNPPNEAKPRVWWHWMNGNITMEGIRKDLEWMHRTGIGGFQNFDANLFTPVVVEKKLVFMDPDWKAAFKYTTELADSLNLEMAIAGSPGWSVTGGPWVEPRDGMKKYVWSELVIEGDQMFKGKLPDPPGNTGSFQNVSSEASLDMSNDSRDVETYYNDAAVIAFKLLEEPTDLLEVQPKVTSSAGQFSINKLADGDLQNGTYLLPSKVGEKMWIQYEFPTPQTFRSYSVTGAYHDVMEQFNGSPDNREILVSDDGEFFKKISDIPGTLVPQTTASFPETKARFWRFSIETLPPSSPGLAAMFGAPTPTEPDGIYVSEFNLYKTSRIDLFEQKAGFAAWQEKSLPTAKNAHRGISPENVVDLSDMMDAKGILNWEVPEGNWKVIRLGYSLTGRENHPASPEATGLEVDKLDEDAVRKYINTYLDMYKDATGGRMGAEGLGYLILDSYEAGHMNWTHDMFEEFSMRRGYDMKPWIPVMTGHIVKDLSQSEKFLWDFRKTIGELIVENHYDVIGEELHKRGMKRYTEAHENGRIYLADGMDVKRNADIPMSAMWTPGSLAIGSDEEVRSEADIREAASVANIYGKPFVAAESMTSIQNAFSWHPEKLKRTADMELASGLNRYVIHTSVHQPLDDKMPGFSLGPFGQYFTRQETWSGAGARAWIEYLSRSSYLLQQGQNVADILYYYGENTNITLVSQKSLPSIPLGFEFDYVNASILKEDINAKDGKMVAPSGTTYKVLMLDASAREMSLGVLKKIHELQEANISVIGTLPEVTPSLEDDIEEFEILAREVASNMLAFDQLELEPDVTFSRTNHKLLYKHRKIGMNEHIYWLNNRSKNPTSLQVDFRVGGKKPELWNPVTGAVKEVSYTMEKGRTQVDLNLDSWGSAFIVFIDDSNTQSFKVSNSGEKQIALLNGSWMLSFQKERGAPEQVQLDSLRSLTEHSDQGIKYFSGTASYSKTFDMPVMQETDVLVLDLGKVYNLAEVFVNGKSQAVVWKTPFKLDLNTADLQYGENLLEIRVTNTWVNRLIGDAQPQVNEKITFTTMPFYQGNEPLLTSGLLGPVNIKIRQAR